MSYRSRHYDLSRVTFRLSGIIAGNIEISLAEKGLSKSQPKTSTQPEAETRMMDIASFHLMLR